MWLSTPGGPDASVLGAVARSAIELLAGHDRERLRVCGAHGCDRLFIAATPRRQWCSPACGNRVRVARHAARYRLR
jgi:predicted RNA-binding Zn ribbon-like protein